MAIESFDGRPAPLPTSGQRAEYARKFYDSTNPLKQTPIVEIVEYDEASLFTKFALNYVRMQREETETTATLFKVLFGVKYIVARASKNKKPDEPEPIIYTDPRNLFVGMAGEDVKQGQLVAFNLRGEIVLVRTSGADSKKPPKKKRVRTRSKFLTKKELAALKAGKMVAIDLVKPKKKAKKNVKRRK